MKAIYANCTTDLVWLGEADKETQPAISIIKKMKALEIQRVTSHGTKEFTKGSKFIHQEVGSAYYPARRILTVPALWQRVWVMQELAVCPKAILVIGKYTLDWEVLSGILDHSDVPDKYHLPFSHQGLPEQLWDLFAKTQVVSHQRDIVRGLKPVRRKLAEEKNDWSGNEYEGNEGEVNLNSTLIDVLARFRGTYSTDPRDKIYGLLGLATDLKVLNIEPDYNKSVARVYMEVAVAHMNAARDLDLICQSQWPLGSPDRPNPYDRDGKREKELFGSSDEEQFYQLRVQKIGILPSWLADFSATAAQRLLFAQREIFNAGRPTISQPLKVPDDGVLPLHGTLLGKIKVSKEVRKGTRSGGLYFSPWARDWMPDSLRPASSSSTSTPSEYFGGEDRFQAFWRTLMLDCVTHPSRRLKDADIDEYAMQFATWREKIAKQPNGWEGAAWKSKEWDKYDGDQELLYSMGNLANATGIDKTIWGWKFVEVEMGMMGAETELHGDAYAMVPWGSRVGDVLAIVDGGKVPLVLRSVEHGQEGDKRWEVIGAAYVHGFMDGHAVRWSEEGRLEEQDLLII